MNSGSGKKTIKSHRRLTVNRRAIKPYSAYPGYHTRLPWAFPYFWQGTVQEVESLVIAMAKENSERWEEDGSTDMLCYAATFHTYTRDSHMTLWLSSGAAAWLTGSELVAAVYQYERELRLR